MIDFDIYKKNPAVERFLQSIAIKAKNPNVKNQVYISTCNPCSHWAKNLYDIYYNIKLTEVQYESETDC